MRVVVTGANGFVGEFLVSELVRGGDQVVGCSRSGRWRAGLNVDARIEPLDLANAMESELVEWLGRKQPHVIYHLAAQSNPSQSLADPRGTWATNLGGTLNLLEAVRHLPAHKPDAPRPRVVVVSSGVCYGNPAPEHLLVREDCPVRPNNPYAASKASADLLAIQNHLAHGTDVVIARPFNHAGPGQSDTYVLSSLCRQIAEIELGSRQVVEHGNLEVVRDFTDVRDIVSAYRRLAESGQAGEIYNIGTGRDISLQSMLEIAKSLATCEIPSCVDAKLLRPVDQPRLLADSTKLRSATGWTPRLSIEQTLSDMVDHWRSTLRRAHGVAP